jgi:hypothetical protein
MSEPDWGGRGFREQQVGLGYFQLRYCCLMKVGVKIYWLLGMTIPAGTARNFTVSASRFHVLIT